MFVYIKYFDEFCRLKTNNNMIVYLIIAIVAVAMFVVIV